MQYSINAVGELSALKETRRLGKSEMCAFPKLTAEQRQQILASGYNYVATAKDGTTAFTWLGADHWDRLRREFLKNK